MVKNEMESLATYLFLAELRHFHAQRLEDCWHDTVLTRFFLSMFSKTVGMTHGTYQVFFSPCFPLCFCVGCLLLFFFFFLMQKKKRISAHLFSVLNQISYVFGEVMLCNCLSDYWK